MAKKWLISAVTGAIQTWVFDDEESARAKFREFLNEDIEDMEIEDIHREDFEEYVKNGRYYDGDDYELIMYESEED